jgi:hypothetical protein
MPTKQPQGITARRLSAGLQTTLGGPPSRHIALFYTALLVGTDLIYVINGNH